MCIVSGVLLDWFLDMWIVSEVFIRLVLRDLYSYIVSEDFIRLVLGDVSCVCSCIRQVFKDVGFSKAV